MHPYAPSSSNLIYLYTGHIFHAESSQHTDTTTEPPTDNAIVANLNPPNVLRRSTLTPPILRRKPGPPIPQPPSAPSPSIAIANISTRAKPTKKHRQPTIERTSKIKLQLDALRNGGHSTSPLPSSSVKSVDVRKTQTFDVNGSANRYSFVSEDTEPVVSHSSTASSTAQNGTNVRGFGEAEVIIIPSTGDDNMASSNTATKPRSNVTPIMVATTERRENRIGQVVMARNSTATIQKVFHLFSINFISMDQGKKMILICIFQVFQYRRPKSENLKNPKKVVSHFFRLI